MSYPKRTTNLPRRGFLGRLSAVAAGLAALGSLPHQATAADSPIPLRENDPDAWIDRLRGRDRLLFHAHERLVPAIGGARNVLVNAREAYGVSEAENSIAVATHGPAIAGMFGNEIWQRFDFGTLYKITDPKTGAPAPLNPFLGPQDGLPPDANVPALLARGVVFLVCNVAVRRLARNLATDAAGAEAILRQLVAGVVPGVVVVPDLFVAMAHAQKRGVSYIFVD